MQKRERTTAQSGERKIKEPKCRCYGCRKVFPRSEIVRGSAAEYPGGNEWGYEASPCCVMGFWEE